MKLIHGKAIKAALREISPTNIAVAYVGIDWPSYLDVKVLKDIVLSPTIGTNPFAVAKLVKELRWENIYFLDNLHTKIYLGESSAAIGSFNLTANGLSAEGLEEAGVIVSNPELLVEANALMKRYKELAVEAYPTVKDKKNRLAELRATWDRAIRTGAIRNDSENNSILDYDPTSSNELYICWVSGEMEHSEEIPSHSTINNSLSFLESDAIEPDRWILCWYARKDGRPDDRYKPYWLHIDEVIPGGAIHEIYTKAAVERNDRQELSPPFDLTDETIKAFRTALCSGRFPEFLATDSVWSVDTTMPKTLEFLEAVRANLIGPGFNASIQQLPASNLDENELRALFRDAILQAMEISVEKKYVKLTIHGMLQTTHPVELAKKLVKGTYLRPGLKNLFKANALQLSFESIMLEPRFSRLFSQEDLVFARWNLTEVDPSYKHPS
jgi:hypothetical protein